MRVPIEGERVRHILVAWLRISIVLCKLLTYNRKYAFHLQITELF
jgi:hypothetical protein